MTDQAIETPTTNEKYATRYPQSEVNYTPDYVGDNHCASCRWFIAHSEYGEGCTIVENYPADILPTGNCNKHEVVPQAEPYVQLVEIVTGSAEVTTTATGNVDTLTPLPIPQVPQKQSVIAQMKAFVGDMLHKRVDPQATGFKVYGNHWVGWWTNNAQDRDKEWFPTKAIDDYVDRVDVGAVPFPELWFWHIPGTRHGVAEWLGRVGHYCVAVGSFDDTPAGKAAREHYTKSKTRYQMSHGFAYDKTQYKDGAYHQFNTFELTTLPAEHNAAANPYTDFEGIKAMEITPEKQQGLERLVGKETADAILAETEAKNKALDELNVQFKDYVEVNPTSTKATDECVKRYVDEGMSEDDAKAKCAEKALTGDKALTALVLDILRDQGGMVTIVDAMGKAIKAKDEATNATIEALKTQLAEIKAELDLRPRQASKDDATKLDPNDPKQKALQDAVADQAKTTDPFWLTTVTEK